MLRCPPTSSDASDDESTHRKRNVIATAVQRSVEPIPDTLKMVLRPRAVRR